MMMWLSQRITTYDWADGLQSQLDMHILVRHPQRTQPTIARWRSNEQTLSYWTRINILRLTSQSSYI